MSSRFGSAGGSSPGEETIAADMLQTSDDRGRRCGRTAYIGKDVNTPGPCAPIAIIEKRPKFKNIILYF